jgi:hypothetical protein
MAEETYVLKKIKESYQLIIIYRSYLDLDSDKKLLKR